jgi:hypothetical protein
VSRIVELASIVEPQEAAVGELELDATARIGPDPIAGQERNIEGGLFRGRLGSALNRDPVLEVSDAPVAVLVLRVGGSGAARQHQEQ